MFVTPTLTVNLSAIVANWKMLANTFAGDETAAVVKADAYGLGMVPVSQALAKAGCHTFFVATLEEALDLRKALPNVRILVFHGVQAGEEFAFATHKIIPVLNSREQLARWKPIAKDHVHAVSALHIDTAMGRLGLQPEDFDTLDASWLTDCRVSLIMSHLACAPDRHHPLNALQLAALTKASAKAAGIPVSFANSGGIFLSRDFHFNLARPGCSLYGIAPEDNAVNPMHQVAHWQAPILQIRATTHEQSVGYGATCIVPKGTKVATVASGYADGYHRILTNKSCAYLGAHKMPLLGRVTMDMVCFDATQVPESELKDGALVSLLGNREGITVDALADHASTIGYEIFTRIGTRVKRVYVEEAV